MGGHEALYCLSPFCPQEYEHGKPSQRGPGRVRARTKAEPGLHQSQSSPLAPPALNDLLLTSGQHQKVRSFHVRIPTFGFSRPGRTRRRPAAPRTRGPRPLPPMKAPQAHRVGAGRQDAREPLALLPLQRSAPPFRLRRPGPRSARLPQAALGAQRKRVRPALRRTGSAATPHGLTTRPPTVRRADHAPPPGEPRLRHPAPIAAARRCTWYSPANGSPWRP